MTIQESELMTFNKILQSNAAPTERRFFKDDEDNLRPYHVRLGPAWSKKECKAKAQNLARALIQRVSEKDQRDIKATAGKMKNKEAADIFVISSVVMRTAPIIQIQTHAPAFARLMSRRR